MRLSKSRIVLSLILSLAANLPQSTVAATNEEIVTVTTQSGHEQRGVLSFMPEATKPTRLIVLVSGYPGITRPRVTEQGKITTSQNGNFLVRARHHFLSERTITLLLDCRSDFNLVCPDEYQASVQRARDIQILIDQVIQKFPGINQIWAVSTSRGVLTTAALLNNSQPTYAGIVHTAGTYQKAVAQGVEFGPFKTPQYIFHHKNDPCPMTPYRDAEKLQEKWGIRLVGVVGGSGFRGEPCQAFTQHGFAGREDKVAHAIRRLVEKGILEENEIN